MTDYREEQEGEVEALRSIYPEEELKIVSDDPHYCIEVKISVEDESNPVSVTVRFQLPVNYPDELPDVIVTTGSGMEAGELRDLERVLTEQASDNVGTVMVFTLVCGAQEHLQQMVETVREEREKEKREKEEEAQRLEEAKYRGTIVTAESFKAWKEKFDEEMREKRGKVKEENTTTSGRLTGRQMFEQDTTLALSDAKFFTEIDDDVELKQEEVEQEVEVDESLFEEMEDLALETDS